jgi:hypothetical protein
MADSDAPGVDAGGQPQMSLGTAAARNLATTTKSVPQMQGITSRWLLRILPWVQVPAGTYRVNRRLSYAVGDGRVKFDQTGAEVRVIPKELCELPLLRGVDDVAVLGALASRFVQQQFGPGDVIVVKDQPAGQLFLIAHGKANKIGVGEYGGETVLNVLADGDYFGDRPLAEPQSSWEFTVKAVTACTVLALPHQVFQELLNQSEALRAHVEQFRARPALPQNKHGEADIALASGHVGEPELPGTFADYEVSPREYELSVAQTVLRVHTRVAVCKIKYKLLQYNEPMNQIEQQLRLTIEALRERQEHEMINNPGFGLLHNADFNQCISTRTGPPTPDDLDELLSRRRKTRFILAHPRTIAAFGRECNHLGIYPQSIDMNGHMMPAWRGGIPSFPATRSPSARPARAPAWRCVSARRTKVSSACTKLVSPMSTSPA